MSDDFPDLADIADIGQMVIISGRIQVAYLVVLVVVVMADIADIGQMAIISGRIAMARLGMYVAAIGMCSRFTLANVWNEIDCIIISGRSTAHSFRSNI